MKITWWHIRTIVWMLQNFPLFLANASCTIFATCGRALSCNKITLRESMPGRLFLMAFCSLSVTVVFDTHLLPYAACILRWMSTGRHPSNERNWIAALWASLDGFWINPAIFSTVRNRTYASWDDKHVLFYSLVSTYHMTMTWSCSTYAITRGAAQTDFKWTHLILLKLLSLFYCLSPIRV